MNRIETKILNCSAVSEAEKTMVFAARLTQRGHLIHNMEDLIRLYNQSFTNDTIKNMGQLPHPAIQKFAVITVAVVGASRRFLSQITRHQNEVKFMSASLQYSNYSGEADFAIPYEILTAPTAIKELYEKSCRTDMDNYARLQNRHQPRLGRISDAPGIKKCSAYQCDTLPVEAYDWAAFLQTQHG